MVQGCLRLKLLEDASNFEVGVVVSRVQFNNALEILVSVLLMPTLTRLDLSENPNSLITVLEFVLGQNRSQVKFGSLKISLKELDFCHTK